MMKFPPSSSTRRRFVMSAASLSALPVITACASRAKTASDFKVGALLAGRINDRGFMEAGWSGLERARTDLRVQTRFIDNIAPQKDQLTAALTELAGSGVDLVVAHGGQNNEACAAVAAKFPGVRFAVTQGAVQSANLCSYDVLQEESAYLGGVLAALTSRTGVIGHMSGIRVRPGLKGRAAYVAGARSVRPDIRVLTNFSGNQDDNALSQRVASAQIAAGADVIFTMLNAGRDGLKEMADESDRLGNTISAGAAANAEAFNDNLTRVHTALGGIINTITAAALPVFRYLSERFPGSGDPRALDSLRDVYAAGDDGVKRDVLQAWLIAGRKDAVYQAALSAKSEDEANEAIRMLGGITIPLMLLSLGVSLSRMKIHNTRTASVLAGLRLAIGLGVGIAVAWAFDLSPLERGVLILDSVMPSAVFNYLLAERFKAAADDVAGGVALSTLLSFALLPFVLPFVL